MRLISPGRVLHRDKHAQNQMDSRARAVQTVRAQYKGSGKAIDLTGKTRGPNPALRPLFAHDAW
eukprot:1518983-Rhodomonas_salina.1